MTDNTEAYIKRIKEFLDKRPMGRGIVVFWDGEKMEYIDVSNENALHAAEFATRYRDDVLREVGLQDFLYERSIGAITGNTREAE